MFPWGRYAASATHRFLALIEKLFDRQKTQVAKGGPQVFPGPSPTKSKPRKFSAKRKRITRAGTPTATAKIGHILGDHGPGSNRCTGANLNSGEQDCTMPDPHVVAENDLVAPAPGEELVIVIHRQLVLPAARRAAQWVHDGDNSQCRESECSLRHCSDERSQPHRHRAARQIGARSRSKDRGPYRVLRWFLPIPKARCFGELARPAAGQSARRTSRPPGS